MVPALAAEIPTLENGGVSTDLLAITWRLRDDVVWSDGSPFTAADVAFTAAFCMDPEGACSAASRFQDVKAVEAIDDRTVRITFKVPMPFPYVPFVGSVSPVIQEKQFSACTGRTGAECTEQNFGPVGTGPFKVAEFRPNDIVLYDIERQLPATTDQPAFSSVLLKGGGDAVSAARAVLETGEFDYAWNLQVEPEILAAMAAAGRGEIVSAFGSMVERLFVQLTNPDPALGDRTVNLPGGPESAPVPLGCGGAARAVDGDRPGILVAAGYGPAGRVACSVLPAPAIYASTANDMVHDPGYCGCQPTARRGRRAGCAALTVFAPRTACGLSILYQTSTTPSARAPRPSSSRCGGRLAWRPS